jgi:hypothetical protein
METRAERAFAGGSKIKRCVYVIVLAGVAEVELPLGSSQSETCEYLSCLSSGWWLTLCQAPSIQSDHCEGDKVKRCAVERSGTKRKGAWGACMDKGLQSANHGDVQPRWRTTAWRGPRKLLVMGVDADPRKILTNLWTQLLEMTTGSESVVCYCKQLTATHFRKSDDDKTFVLRYCKTGETLTFLWCCNLLQLYYDVFGCQVLLRGSNPLSVSSRCWAS